MRRALICQRGGIVVFMGPRRLAVDQQLHPAHEARDVALLPGHHIRQVIDRPGQMRNAFFEGRQIGHAVVKPLLPGFGKGFCGAGQV